MLYRKITHGFVVQQFNDAGEFLNQEFVAGDCEWENENGDGINPMDMPLGGDEYHPFGMVQNLDACRKFAVVLLYPDYMQQSGHDTYIETVVAASADKAIEAVQQLAVTANAVGASSIDPDDFAVLAVFAGNPELLLSNI